MFACSRRSVAPEPWPSSRHSPGLRGRQLIADGSASPYGQRTVLETQLERAADARLELRLGYEPEFVVGRDADKLAPAHRGPATARTRCLTGASGVGKTSVLEKLATLL
jgi:hypothetical protein